MLEKRYLAVAVLLLVGLVGCDSKPVVTVPAPPPAGDGILITANDERTLACFESVLTSLKLQHEIRLERKGKAFGTVRWYPDSREQKDRLTCEIMFCLGGTREPKPGTFPEQCKNFE